MPGRTFLFMGLLILAVAGPFLLSKEGLRQHLGKSSTKTVEVDSKNSTVPYWKQALGLANAPETAVQVDVPSADPAGRIVDQLSIGNTPGLSLADVLSFDVNPNWVKTHWSRVTTMLSETDLHGMRVPLMTGTEAYDVAGSLTYFFNAQNVVERIQLRGFTNNPERVVGLVASRFQLTQYASIGPGLYMRFLEGSPIAVLRLEHSPLQDSANPMAQFAVEMELNRPGTGVVLSDTTLNLLRELRKSHML